MENSQKFNVRGIIVSTLALLIPLVMFFLPWLGVSQLRDSSNVTLLQFAHGLAYLGTTAEAPSLTAEAFRYVTEYMTTLPAEFIKTVFYLFLFTTLACAVWTLCSVCRAVVTRSRISSAVFGASACFSALLLLFISILNTTLKDMSYGLMPSSFTPTCAPWLVLTAGIAGWILCVPQAKNAGMANTPHAS